MLLHVLNVIHETEKQKGDSLLLGEPAGRLPEASLRLLSRETALHPGPVRPSGSK